MATQGDDTWPADQATGVPWLPRCTLDATGACPYSLPVTGTVVDGTFSVQSWSIVPPDDATPTAIILEPTDVACTEEECPPEAPCCHECGHSGWQITNRRPEVTAHTTAGTATLPRCELSGCGKCSYRLVATGIQTGGLFVVTSWEETTSDALYPMGRCTMIACMGSNPCCNTCGFMGWSIQRPTGSLDAVPGMGVEALPPCELDGCGACSFQLLVEGEDKDGSFEVTSWKRRDP